jgi:hypothetical protein
MAFWGAPLLPSARSAQNWAGLGGHMRKFKAGKLPSIALFLLLAVVLGAAASPDHGLLSLVPPDAQIVAGMNSMPTGPQPGNFLLITHNNVVDLEDFFALSGADDSRVIEQVVLVAGGGNSDGLSEHSLLARGHFDKDHIYRSVSDGGATVAQYRGIKVLVVQPFDRDRHASRDQRWLVILDSGSLVFGTIPTTTGPSLLQRLARMRSGEDTWCILNTPARNPEIKNALAALDPKLSELTEEGDSLQFGIRYGRHIEFEYEITTAAGSTARNISNALAQSIVGEPMTQSSLLTPQNSRDNVAIEHGLVKVSRAQYGRWLNDVEARMRARMTTPHQALLSAR